MRRYLDYGKRLKEGAGLDEFYQWIATILLDDGQVYSSDEQALVFEIGTCELVADQWGGLAEGTPADLVLNQLVDKCAIYRLILQETAPLSRRIAFFRLLEKRYKKQYNWIEELAASKDRYPFAASSGGRLFSQFLLSLDESAPVSVAEEGVEVDRFLREIQRRNEEMEELQQDLEIAEERATRVQKRLRDQDLEVDRLKKQLRDERENGEKLRSERKTRIKSQRQSGEAQHELDKLRREYLKLDARLKEMASRLAKTEGRDIGGELRVSLDGLRRLDVGRLLGIGERVDEAHLGQVRRRFAAAFHPDRTGELPQWVRELFVEVLGLVNEACDRAKKQ